MRCLFSDLSETKVVGNVVDTSRGKTVIDGVRASDPGVGIAGLVLGWVDVAVAVLDVSQLVLGWREKHFWIQQDNVS